jgi:peptide/nickel transport system ATP-binding protein
MGARLAELLAQVNLAPEFLDRYPHEFSGGQAQRIGIARALAPDPALLVLDEPVSALDVSVQAQVLNLLSDLKARLGLTYVFISHDLSVVQTVCDRVAVMYFGRVVEVGPVGAIFERPRHPYTRLLLDSVPVPGRKPTVPEDANTELPDPYDPPPGCAFRARCPWAVPRCATDRPVLDDAPHAAACWEAPPPAA